MKIFGSMEHISKLGLINIRMRVMCTTAVDPRRLISTHRNYSRNTESSVKVQAVQEDCLTLEDETDRLSRKVGN